MDKKVGWLIGLGALATGIWWLSRRKPEAEPPPILPPPPPEPGLANLYGRVTDATTGQAIAGVFVSLNGYSTYTDNAGSYLFADLQPGSYVVEFSREGYQTGVF